MKTSRSRSLPALVVTLAALASCAPRLGAQVQVDLPKIVLPARPDAIQLPTWPDDNPSVSVLAGRSLVGASPEYRAAVERAALEELQMLMIRKRIRLDYEHTSLDQRAAVFAWQHRSTVLIFWLVTMVVLSGLGLSFWHVFRKESAPTKIVIGDKGIELSSRLVGVLVFVLSLGFFYLYLHQVYPISEVGSGTGSNAETTGGKDH